jgi:hypothetical protein
MSDDQAFREIASVVAAAQLYELTHELAASELERPIGVGLPTGLRPDRTPCVDSGLYRRVSDRGDHAFSAAAAGEQQSKDEQRDSHL